MLVPQLTDEVAIVTGAARGIGRGVALGLAEAGASVVVVDLLGEAAEQTAQSARELGARALAIQADVARSADVARVVDVTLTELGRIDVLVNNAAIDNACDVVEMSDDAWATMISVNLTSVFLCCRAVLPTMIAQRAGRIVNMGSNLALKGGERLAHYCAAKAGVHGFTRALALEVAAHGITVNVVAPGPVETEMLRSLPQDWLDAKRATMPLGRFATVEEIVPTVVLLASQAGSFYTGSTLNISGGDVIM